MSSHPKKNALKIQENNFKYLQEIKKITIQKWSNNLEKTHHFENKSINLKCLIFFKKEYNKIYVCFLKNCLSLFFAILGD